MGTSPARMVVGQMMKILMAKDGAPTVEEATSALQDKLDWSSKDDLSDSIIEQFQTHAASNSEFGSLLETAVAVREFSDRLYELQLACGEYEDSNGFSEVSKIPENLKQRCLDVFPLYEQFVDATPAAHKAKVEQYLGHRVLFFRSLLSI